MPADPVLEAPIFHAQAISKRFGGKQALSNVDIALHPGRIHGLIGPNGAGKSTLIGVLAGTVTPEAGQVHLAGQNLATASPRTRARAGLARTFQTPQVFESLTLHQHILLAAPPGAPDENWGLEAADLLGLTPLLARTAATFSHGLRRLAEICHVVAARPRILLLDEPAAGLTSHEMAQLDRALRWLSTRSALCLVEHNMAFLLGVADDITVLDHGQVIATGTPAHVTAHPAVRTAYLGPGFNPGLAPSAK